MRETADATRSRRQTLGFGASQAPDTSQGMTSMVFSEEGGSRVPLLDPSGFPRPARGRCVASQCGPHLFFQATTPPTVDLEQHAGVKGITHVKPGRQPHGLFLLSWAGSQTHSLPLAGSLFCMLAGSLMFSFSHSFCICLGLDEALTYVNNRRIS